MELLVDRAQILSIHVGVDLRGGEIGVAQHLLQRAKVGTALEQVSGEAVPERVRRDALPDARTGGSALDDAPGTDAGERPATGVEQHATAARAAVELRPKLVQIDRDRADDGASDRNQPLLATFTEHANQVLGEEQVGGSEPAELRHAKTRSVAKLEQGAIAPGQRLVDVGHGEQPFDLLHRERIGQDAAPTRRLQAVARIGRHAAFSDQERVIGADRGYAPPDRGGAQSEVLEEVDELAQHRASELPGIAHALRGGELRQAAKIATVGLHGIRAVSRLERQVVAEALEAEVAGGALAHIRGGHWPGSDRARWAMPASSAGPIPRSSAARCINLASCSPMAPSAKATLHIRSTSSSRSARPTRFRSRRA